MAFFWIVSADWLLIGFVFIFNSTNKAPFTVFAQGGLLPQSILSMSLYITFKHFTLNVRSSSFIYLTGYLRHFHWVLPHGLQILQIQSQTHLISFLSLTKSTPKLLLFWVSGGKTRCLPSCLSQESRCQPHPLRLINAQIYQVYFLKCSHLLFNSHQYTTGLLSSLLPGLPKSNSPHPTPIFIFNLSSILPLGWSFQYAHLICPKCIAGFQWQQSPWSINNARKRPCPTIQIYF